MSAKCFAVAMNDLDVEESAGWFLFLRAIEMPLQSGQLLGVLFYLFFFSDIAAR